MRNRIVFFYFLLFFNLGSAWSSGLSDYRPVKCVIHLHTDISSGRRPLQSYVKEAREKGIAVIVVTDEDWRRWEYGLPPFRNLFKWVVEKKSVMTFGIDKYLNLIHQLNNKYKDIIVIDGVQTNPFYFWSGNFLRGTLTLNNRNKDMLIVGFNNAEAYKNMPIIATHKSKFDAYHADRFILPYQELIDYVTERGGLIFWSHPEYEENRFFQGVRLITLPYYWDLVSSENYTGFGVFWEGYKKIGKPLGIWDRVLTEYCRGKRTSPVWAIGELEEEGLGKYGLEDIINILFIEDFSRQGVLEALKKGRFYCRFNLFNRIPLRLDEFQIYNEWKNKFAVMGQEARFADFPILKFKVSFKQPSEKHILVNLIRNNKIIKEFKGKQELEIEYKDKEVENKKKYYYRLDVKDNDGNQLVSNPIFFTKISGE